MTIEVNLSGPEFRRFTVFDLLRRRKQWRGPALFALILGLSAAVCFTRAPARGAVLLGSVLLGVGLGVPCVYFAFFFSSGFFAFFFLLYQVLANLIKGDSIFG